MKNIRLKNILTGFGFITILFTLIPFVALDYWWIRIFDYPHLQLTFLTLSAVLLYVIKFDFRSWRDYVFIVTLILCLLYQFAKIYPYTALADYEVLEATSTKKTISLFTANVLQENDRYDLVTTMFKSKDTDILLFTETDQKWMNEIKKNLNESYSEEVEVPLDNTYGMILYSKLPLFDTHVKFLVSDSVPSIHTKLKLASNDTIQLYAIHPTPPMPQENPMSTDRDAELMMIAKLALNSKYPVIVVGDFNDVAWSQTSKLFENVSRLADPRKGRGLYNTYNAKNPIMRWPLDHIFVSSDFKVDFVERCEDINSDHFPLHTVFSYEPKDRALTEKPKPTDEQLKRANDQIENYKESSKK